MSYNERQLNQSEKPVVSYDEVGQLLINPAVHYRSYI